MTATPIRGQILTGATCLVMSTLPESLVLVSVLAFANFYVSSFRTFSHCLQEPSALWTNINIILTRSSPVHAFGSFSLARGLWPSI